MHSRLVFLAIAGLFVLSLPRAASAADIEGTWLNGKGDGLIELRIIDAVLEGRIVGSPDDPLNLKPSRLDELNPDPALRTRPLRGLTILTGFVRDADGTWHNGRIYDPNSGKTYRGTITPVDANTLKLRGFVGISLFGRTDTWRRHRPDSR